jgi:serine/alanine adding enzyme
MTILTNKNIPSSKWDELITSNKFSSPFQSRNFFDLFNSVPGYQAVAFAAEDSGKILVLIVVTLQKGSGIKGFFSSRAIIYGGPLIEENCESELNAVLAEISRVLSGRAIYFEVRNLHDYSRYLPAFFLNKWDYIPYSNFLLETMNTSLEKILSGMSYNRRREINLSLKQGAIYEECKSVADLKNLYAILKDLYLKKVKLPLPQYDFFEQIYLRDFGKVFVVKHNDIIIGGSICPYLAHKSIITFYYCGLREYDKKIFPTHLAIVAAIEYAVGNEFEYLDFMGAGKPEVYYGVRKYKQEFGGNYVEYGRFIKISKPLLYRIGKTALSILKRF